MFLRKFSFEYMDLILFHTMFNSNSINTGRVIFLDNSAENNVNKDETTEGNEEKKKQAKGTNAFVLWCMGMSAPMSAMEGCSCNPFSSDPAYQDDQRKRLASNWDIHDVEGLRSAVNELLKEEKSEFDDIIPFIGNDSIDDVTDELEDLGVSEELAATIAKAIPGITAKFKELGLKVPDKTMFAWDIVRAAFIALSGSAAGYIPRDEALYVLGNAGMIANKFYSTWNDYVSSFLFALRLWSVMDVGYDEGAEMANPSYQFVHALLNGENSVCNRIPFDFGVKEQASLNERVKAEQQKRTPEELYKGSLDLYCGTFTRYYAKNWRTCAQKLADAVGVQYVGENMAEQNIPEDKVMKSVVQWRNSFEEMLKKSFKDQCPTSIFTWTEDNVQDYMTLRPDWDGFGALQLWALHSEQGLPMYKKIPANQEIRHEDGGSYLENQSRWKWYEEDAYLNSRKPGYTTRYPVLMNCVSMFVPCELMFAVRGSGPAGNDIVISTVQALLTDLNRLNDQTWKASREEILSWKEKESCKNLKAIEVENGAVKFLNRTEGREVDTMESLAKYGFSVFYTVAEYAAEHNLPILLDY